MMKKRFVSMALAVSMAGSLTACGGGAAKTESAAAVEPARHLQRQQGQSRRRLTERPI